MEKMDRLGICDGHLVCTGNNDQDPINHLARKNSHFDDTLQGFQIHIIEAFS